MPHQRFQHFDFFLVLFVSCDTCTFSIGISIASIAMEATDMPIQNAHMSFEQIRENPNVAICNDIISNCIVAY